MTIRAGIDGNSPVETRTTHLMGAQPCGGCGRRGCGGECATLNRIPEMKDAPLR